MLALTCTLTRRSHLFPTRDLVIELPHQGPWLEPSATILLITALSLPNLCEKNLELTTALIIVKLLIATLRQINQRHQNDGTGIYFFDVMACLLATRSPPRHLRFVSFFFPCSMKDLRFRDERESSSTTWHKRSIFCPLNNVYILHVLYFNTNFR